MKYRTLLLCLLLAAYAHGQSFQPDLLFGNSGTVLTVDTARAGILNDITLQGDGKIVAAGFLYEGSTSADYHTCLVRYNTDGSLDASFGTNGKVITAVGSQDMAYAVSMGPGGTIIAGGNETIITHPDPGSTVILTRPFLLKYKSDGTLDSTFGVDGIHRLPLLNNYAQRFISAISVRADGSIYVGGAIKNGNVYKMYIMALTPTGDSNTGFGTGGLVVFEVEAGRNAMLYDLVSQPDGKLLAAGYSGEANLSAPPNSKAALVRVNPNGSLDVGFNGGKIAEQVSMTGTPYDVAQAIALQDDGKIVLAGGSDNHQLLLRYQADGTLDPTFGTGGITVNNNLTLASNICIDHNGKLLTLSMVTYQSPYRTDIVLARHNANGTPDATFGTAGALPIDKSINDKANTIVMQPDHKILIGGQTNDPLSGQISFTMLRYTDDNPGTAIRPPAQNDYKANLYPNPATDKVLLSLERRPIGPVTIRIVNEAGQTMLESVTQQALTTINTTALASGAYLLYIVSEGKTRSFRLQITK